MSETHAILSPSSAKRWLSCAGAPAMEAGQPDSTSKYAAEGTVGHDMSAQLLRDGVALDSHLGKTYTVDGHAITVDDDLVRACETYTRYVLERVHYHERAGASVMLEVEQAVPIDHITGETGATGTADTVIMAEYPDGRCILDVIDLKLGRGVIVNAGSNPQLMMYASGSAEKFSLVFSPNEIVMHIVQPRIADGTSTAGMGPEELSDWVAKSKPRAEMALQLLGADQATLHASLEPTTDGCRFCRAAGICPKLREQALATVADDFVDLDADLKPQLDEAVMRIARSDDAHLDALFPVLDLIENWVSAVRIRVEGRLLAGATMRNAKLVEGKRGNRAWTDAAGAETALKTMRLKVEEMYDLKLISPTTAEKLAKAQTIGPRQWKKLQELITQPPGKPAVAASDDTRPALVMAASPNDFADLDEEALA